jgi:membrane associated rhomboid family serine protease
MPWWERDYAKTQVHGGGMMGGSAFAGSRGWAVNTWLLVLNIGIFVLDSILGRIVGHYTIVTPQGSLDPMAPLAVWGHFSFALAFESLQLWRVITFQFLHAGLGHLLGNMLGLYFFGYMVEQWLGSRRYLAFYLLCGIGGVLGYVFVNLTGILPLPAYMPMVGASAGIFGILIAATRIAPNTTVMLLIPPIPMRLKTLAWVLLGIAIFTVFSSGRNAGGEAAHLGGAAMGFLLMRAPQLLGFADGFSRPGRRRRAARSQRPRVDPIEIDRILDKVRAKGLGSLTEQEQRTLRRASEE